MLEKIYFGRDREKYFCLLDYNFALDRDTFNIDDAFYPLYVIIKHHMQIP